MCRRRESIGFVLDVRPFDRIGSAATSGPQNTLVDLQTIADFHTTQSFCTCSGQCIVVRVCCNTRKFLFFLVGEIIGRKTFSGFFLHKQSLDLIPKIQNTIIVNIFSQNNAPPTKLNLEVFRVLRSKSARFQFLRPSCFQ